MNLEKFKPVSFPEEPAFLFIGRLIKDKGIMEFLEACKVIKGNHPEVRCLLVGPFDSNPSALKPEELDFYLKKGIIEYFGEQTDVRPFIAQSSIYVLPSYHEGTPKTVLESMAMGRPIITSDAPVCRETVIEGQNGFLVGVQNIPELVEKMEYFITNPNCAKVMGSESFRMAKEKYDVKNVNKRILEIMGLI